MSIINSRPLSFQPRKLYDGSCSFLFISVIALEFLAHVNSLTKFCFLLSINKLRSIFETRCTTHHPAIIRLYCAHSLRLRWGGLVFNISEPHTTFCIPARALASLVMRAARWRYFPTLAGGMTSLVYSHSVVCKGLDQPTEFLFYMYEQPCLSHILVTSTK